MLTQERLKEVLHYDPETGIFAWQVQTGRSRLDSPAGYTRRDGYRQIKVDKRVYLAHRLAWLFMMGAWPSEEVDHINCNKVDNRWTNLRPATRGQNNANSRARRSKSGIKGVLPAASGRYYAYIGGKNRRHPPQRRSQDSHSLASYSPPPDIFQA